MLVLADLDLNGFGSGFFAFVDAHVQYSVAEFGGDVIGFGIFGHGEGAGEATVGTFYAVVAAALFLVLELAFAVDREDAVFDRDMDVLLFDFGQFCFDGVAFFVFGDIHKRGPLADGHGFFRFAFTAEGLLAVVAVEESEDAVLEVFHFAEGVPSVFPAG